MDFGAREESAVRAAAGVISASGSVPSYGRYLCLLHRFPSGLRSLNALTTCYGYLSSTGREVGDVVERGSVIAASGCSGQYCISPRVHFVVRRGSRPDAEPVDPKRFLGV